MKKFLLSIAVASSLCANENSVKELGEMSLEELMDVKIYSATKSYQRIEEIPANIILITRKDIEKYNHTTLYDLLKSIPSIFIIDDTEHFQIGTRGSMGSSFKVMINNNPIMPLRYPRAGTSNRNLFATPIESIDRIEITKTPQSVTYGNNAIYGSINIITNDFNAKDIVSVGKGTNGQNKIFLRKNHANENGGFTLNASFFNSDGLNGDLEDTFSSSYYSSRDSSAVKKVDGLLEQKYKTLDFSHRYKNLTTDINYTRTNYGFYIDPVFNDGNQVEQTEKSISITYEDEIGDDINYKINLNKSQKDYDFPNLDIYSASAYQYGGFNYDLVKKDYVDAHLNYALTKKISILLGGTYESIKDDFVGQYNNRKLKFAYNAITKDLYTKIHYKIDDSLEFNTGVRYSVRDKFKMDFYGDTDLSNSAYNMYQQSEYDKKSSTLPEISAIYHINGYNHLKLLYGKATQLKYQDMETYEEIETKELNYNYISKDYYISSSIFFNELSNISLFSQSGSNAAVSEKGEVTSRGLEFSITYKPNYKLSTSGSFTYQKSKSSTNIEPSFSPELIAKLSTSYKNDNTTYSLYADFISSMKSATNPQNGQRYGKNSPNNVTVNTNIRQKLSKNTFANLNITNLFDRDNRIPAGSSLTTFYKGGFTQGRIVMLTATHKF